MSSPFIRFFVPGLPKSAGSKRAFVITPKGGGRPRAIVTDDCKGSRDWKGDVKRFASEAFQGAPLAGPLKVTMTFHLPRPKHHFGSGKNAHLVKDGAPLHPAVKPDVLKLARACEDACTGMIYNDDAQIIVEHLEKRYATFIQPGVAIEIERLHVKDLSDPLYDTLPVQLPHLQPGAH